MYIFQLGRDSDISTLELIRVLTSQLGELPEIARDENFVLVKAEELDIEGLACKLAGTLKIAKVFYTSDVLNQGFINSLEFYFPKNFEIYVTSVDANVAEKAVNELNSFKKANKMRGSILVSDENKLKPFAGDFEKVKDEVCEIIILKGEKEYYFAQAQAYADPNEFKFKDEARPVQKFTHGTSPRLAKIMVNILDLEPGKTMVDPFCGIGTFLIEGMIADLNVVGIDYDPEVIKGARKNVEWAKKEFKLNTKCEIIEADSRTQDFKANGCVFEPYMGPFMKKLPYMYEAEKVVYGLENLYSAIFKSLKKNLSDNAEVVCIIPYFQTAEGEIVKVNERVFRDNGFEAEVEPIEYNTPDGSKILRHLWLLQKR